MKDEPEMFYNSISEIIPYNIKNDFVKNNFLLIFVNPKSGSQEGKIILDYVKNFKENSIHIYNIIHFPIEEDDLSDWFPFTRSRTNAFLFQIHQKSFDDGNNNEKKNDKVS